MLCIVFYLNLRLKYVVKYLCQIYEIKIHEKSKFMRNQN